MATVVAVLLLSAISSRLFVAEASVSVLRPASGLLLGMLLLRRASWARAALWLGWGCLAISLGILWAGRSLPLAVGLSLALIIEIGLAFGVLRLQRKDLVGLGDLDSVLWLIGISLLAPVVGGAVAGVLTHRLTDNAILDAWFDWWVGSSFGLWMVLPLVLAWPRESGGSAASVRAHATTLALTLLVCLAAVLWLSHPFVAMALPLLLVAFRAGVFVTALAGLGQAALVLGVFTLQPSGWPPMTPARGLVGMGLAEVVLSSLLVTIPPLVVAVLEQQGRKSLQAMKSLREQLGLITDNVPALVAEIGSDLRYRFANRKYGEWFGKQGDEVLGRTPAEVFGPDIGRRLASRMQRVLAGLQQRFEITMDNGQDLEVRYEPRFGHEGEIDGFLVLAQDVSWRKRNERRFQTLLESAPDAMLVLDRERCIEIVNAQAERTFGFSRTELVGQPIARLIPRFPEIDDDALRLHLQPDSPMRAQGVGLELTGLDSRGDAFPLELVFGEIESEGAPLLLIAARDITRRKQAEQALHESRERAQITLNSIGDAVVACDASMRITQFNPVAESMTGWSCTEAIGQHVHDVVKLIDPASGEPPLSPIEIAMQDKRSVALQTDTMLEHRNGATSRIEDTAAPVLGPEGDVIGGVLVFHDADESGATAIKMSHLAQHDYLTDLPNRVLLHDRMSQALALIDRGAKGALLFVDLDHFKAINDTLGHHAGDEVLQEVARRLTEAVRDDDTVSRQGGDEFVLLLVRLADPRDAARVAEKLIHAIEQPFHVQGETLHISASVGIALFPQDGRDIKTLMKQADTAVYHAKQSGRGRYSYFTGIMSEHAEVRMRMEHDLRLALADESFFLVYQPKVALPDNTIVGMEALVRWRDTEGNIIPPDLFIPVAEETGLIVKLDAWVMLEACRQNRAWQDAGFRKIPVAVNVSLARFDPDQLMGAVTEALRITGMEPACLEIEFTESQMFQHQDAAREMIDKLKDLGVRVAVDDFGTGYSSLSYLVNYKFDTLKIDRSFVKGLPGDKKHYAVVQAIIGMAHALEYKVVAEGVESHAQAETLLRHGCDEMQGYLYSRPVPPDEFVKLLRQGNITLPEVGVGQRPRMA